MEFLDNGNGKMEDADAKQRRSAQNRAAQKAFRERKERKMKELQDKVHKLENINEKNEIESVFLRTQLISLITELKKYRGEKNNDVKVKKLVHSNLRNSTKLAKSISGDSSRLNSLMDDLSAGMNVGLRKTVTEDSSPSSDTSTTDFMHHGLGNSSQFKQFNISTSGYSQASSELSSPTSNFNLNASDLNPMEAFSVTDYMINNNSVNQGVKLNDFDAYGSKESNNKENNGFLIDLDSNVLKYDSNLFSNDFDFANEFDEQVNTFCAKMNKNFEDRKKMIQQMFTEKHKNTSVVTKQISIPQTVDDASNIQRITESPYLNNSFIDASLAFPDQLVLDKSAPMFDFLRDDQNQQNQGKQQSAYNHPIITPIINDQLINNNEMTASPMNSNHNLGVADDDDDDDDDELLGQVVPSTDARLLACSEIWDRITTYPRYSDLDIDGLCEELTSTAKCSDKGVLVASDDVQKVLSRHMISNN